MDSAQTTSNSKPKFKVFDATAMATTFVPTSKPAVTKKATASKPVPVFQVSKPNSKAKAKTSSKCKATQTKPRFDLLKPKEPIAFDAEFQDVKIPEKDWKPRLGWVAVTGLNGKVIYEVFARYGDDDPPGTLQKLPPRRFGVTWDDLKYHNGAVNAREVESNLKKLFKGRTVVLHGGWQDKIAFQYEKAFEGAAEVVDTQKLFSYMQFDGQPGLALLAEILLGKVVQGGGDGDHTPVEDAQTAMELFKQKISEGGKNTQVKGKGEASQDKGEFKGPARGESTLGKF